MLDSVGVVDCVGAAVIPMLDEELLDSTAVLVGPVEVVDSAPLDSLPSGVVGKPQLSAIPDKVPL